MLSHCCAFLSRPLTLGSKGNSPGIQHCVKMELQYQMCMCFMLFRQDKLSVFCHIHRWDNAFLYTFLYNIFVTFEPYLVQISVLHGGSPIQLQTMEPYLPPTFFCLTCSKPFVLVKHLPVLLEFIWTFQAVHLSGLELAPGSLSLPVRYFYPLCLSSLQKACRNLFWHRILAFHDSRPCLFYWEKAWYNNLPLCLLWEIGDTYGSLYSQWWQSFHWITQNYS